MKVIPLKNGKAALVDDADFERLSRHVWRQHSKGYAVRTNEDDPARPLVYMHREVLRARRGQTVDHANGDKLDNQRHNLRACSVAENLWNARPRRNGYKGVSSDERGWRACLAANGEVYRTKRFGTEGEAARAYDALARLHHGRFARLNFPEPQP